MSLQIFLSFLLLCASTLYVVVGFFYLSLHFIIPPLPLSLSLSLGIRHSKIYLWHVVEVITPSLSLPHSISLIFLNLPAQSEVRISFSLSLINLLHLPFFYFPLPPSFSSSLSLPSRSSGSSSPAAFLILLLAQFVSPLLPRFSSHSALCHQHNCRGHFCFALVFLSPSPSLSTSCSQNFFSHSLFKRLLGLLHSTQPVNREPCPYLLAVHHGHSLPGTADVNICYPTRDLKGSESTKTLVVKVRFNSA